MELYDLLERAQLYKRKFERDIPEFIKQQRSKPVPLTEAALAHWHQDMKLLMSFCLKYREVIQEMQEEVEEF